MRTTIEVTSRAIRVCREDKKRIIAIDSYPVPPGADPLIALEEAPLPSPLGQVRLIMNHGDMLLRTMIQPPCPMPRLDRIVRFELQSAAEAEPVASSWHLVAGLGSGDMRVLTMVTKRSLLTELRHALKRHQGKLTSLIHPAIGLYHAYKALKIQEQGASLIVDVGGSNLHLGLLLDGELLFVRSQIAGMDDLVKQVSELRNLPDPDARALIAKIGKGAPSDLHDLISRQVSSIASMLTANVRFAKAQLRMDQFEPKTIWLSGAGAQIFGFSEALAQRTGMTVCAINPFNKLATTLGKDRLDQLSALPSPWTVVLGACQPAAQELDALQEDRNKRALFWKTEGSLRVAAAAVVLLLIATLIRQEFTYSTVQAAINKLGPNPQDGLVHIAEKAHKQLQEYQDAKVDASTRLDWLDGERRPGRVALELLNAIVEQQNPLTCPISLKSFKVSREAHQVTVDIQGFAQGAGKVGSDTVLRHFEQGLVRQYGLITAIHHKATSPDPTRLSFEYLITVCDRHTEMGEVQNTTDGGEKAVKVSLQVPAGVDVHEAATVAAMRARNNDEPLVIVAVSPLVEPNEAKSKTAPTDIRVSFKD